MGIGERLREERERLRLNQEQLGEIGGVRKQAQLLYEKGERSPDAQYLAAVATTGVDVLYVLTGVALDAHARLAVLQATIERVHREGGDVHATLQATEEAEAAIRDARKTDPKGFLSLARAWPVLSPVNRQSLLSLAQAASPGSPQTQAKGRKKAV